jgi:putative addiction module component (TIGR02574 family)
MGWGYLGDMTERTNRLLSEALALAPDERSELIAALLASLEDRADDGEVTEAWREEIARRADRVSSGDVDLQDWDEVRRRLGRSR